MSIFTRVRDYFISPDVTSLSELDYKLNGERAATGLEIYPESVIFNNLNSVFGISDTDTPTETEIKQAYRGLISRLTEMRADEIARGILKCKVARKIDEEEFEPVEAWHPWKRLIETPSRHYSGFEFWRDASKHKDVGYGAALGVVERDEFMAPSALSAIYPGFGQVYARPSSDGGIENFVYHSQGGEPKDIDRDLLIWLRHAHPLSPYMSASLLMQAAYQSDTALYQQIYSRDVVKEGNVPPIYASFKEHISADRAKEYGRHLSKEYRTIRQGGHTAKTLVLGHGAEMKHLGVKPDDLQYVESAGLTWHQIMIIFGFPPAMFSEGGVVANSKEVRKAWIQNSIEPAVEEFAASLTHQFNIIFDSEGSDLCIRAPKLVPIDRMEQARVDEMEIRSGTLMPGEVRKREGREESPALNQFFMSGNLRPVSDIVASNDDDADQSQENEKKRLMSSGAWL